MKSEILCHSSVQNDLDFKTVWRLVSCLFVCLFVFKLRMFKLFTLKQVLSLYDLHYLSLPLLPKFLLGLNSKFYSILIEKTICECFRTVACFSFSGLGVWLAWDILSICRPRVHVPCDWAEYLLNHGCLEAQYFFCPYFAELFKLGCCMWLLKQFVRKALILDLNMMTIEGEIEDDRAQSDILLFQRLKALRFVIPKRRNT